MVLVSCWWIFFRTAGACGRGAEAAFGDADGQWLPRGGIGRTPHHCVAGAWGRRVCPGELHHRVPAVQRFLGGQGTYLGPEVLQPVTGTDHRGVHSRGRSPEQPFDFLAADSDQALR